LARRVRDRRRGDR